MMWLFHLTLRMSVQCLLYMKTCHISHLKNHLCIFFWYVFFLTHLLLTHKMHLCIITLMHPCINNSFIFHFYEDIFYHTISFFLVLPMKTNVLSMSLLKEIVEMLERAFYFTVLFCFTFMPVAELNYWHVKSALVSTTGTDSGLLSWLTYEIV